MRFQLVTSENPVAFQQVLNAEVEAVLKRWDIIETQFSTCANMKNDGVRYSAIIIYEPKTHIDGF